MTHPIWSTLVNDDIDFNIVVIGDGQDRSSLKLEKDSIIFVFTDNWRIYTYEHETRQWEEVSDIEKLRTLMLKVTSRIGHDLASYTSYAEIVGGVSHNRGVIRKNCDKFMMYNRILTEIEKCEEYFKPKPNTAILTVAPGTVFSYQGNEYRLDKMLDDNTWQWIDKNGRFALSGNIYLESDPTIDQLFSMARNLL